MITITIQLQTTKSEFFAVNSKTVDDCETDGNECDIDGNECDTDENCLKQNLRRTQNKILKSVYGHG